MTDLAAFARVAQLRSFKLAATERGVTPSSMSQTIRRLEDEMGTRLLHRTTRSVTPTQAGKALLDGLAPAFDAISRTVETITARSLEPIGKLRINAPPPVAHLVLAPLISDFLEQHPRIEFDLSVDDGLIDVFEAGFDAGIRFEERLSQDAVGVPLRLPMRMIAVAAPRYLASKVPIESPTDLMADHRLIRHRFPNGSVFPWAFEKDGQSFTIVPAGPLTVDDPVVELRAAIDGAGIAFMFDGHAAQAVSAGLLTPILGEWCPSFSGPVLYYSSRRHVPAPLAAFIAFLRARIGRSHSTSSP